MSNRHYNKRRYTCRRRRPHGCAGEGHNGAIGRAKWLRISRRKLRRAERQLMATETPHRTAMLRSFRAPDRSHKEEREDEGMKCYRTEDGTSVTECCGAKLTIERTYHGYSMSKYQVKLLEGEWPADTDLVTICDGDEPPNARHFGGTVTKDGDQAYVTVYTD